MAARHEQLSLRNLSVCAFAMTNISRLKPVILNFDDVFKMMELSFVKKFEGGKVVGQDISNTLIAYSKSQNGSNQFWRALESTVLKHAPLLSPQELSNVIYSYFKAENAVCEELYEALKPTVKKELHKMKPVELC